MNLGIAIAIAAEGFKNKLDKGGRPYIEHCLWVMNNAGGDDERKMIAVLHDVVEDKVCTIQDLVNHKFSQRVIYSIILLTHKPEMPYDEYIKQIAPDEDARAVKMADLRHNSDISRLKGLTKQDFDRIEKYHRSYTYLTKV